MKKKKITLKGLIKAAAAAFTAALAISVFSLPIGAGADDNSAFPYDSDGCAPLIGSEEVEYFHGSDLYSSGYAYNAVSEPTGGSSSSTSRDYFLKCAGLRWGYKDLGTRSNGAKRQQYYDALFDAMIDVWNSESDMTNAKAKGDGYNYELKRVIFSDIGLTNDEAKETFYAFVYDNPIFYFISKNYAVVDINRDNGKTDHAMKMYTYKEYLTGKTRTNYQNAIKKYITSSSSWVSSSDDYYRKALTFHNKIAEGMDYNKVSGSQLYSGYYHSAHNIIGGICNKKGVCESYAKIFQLIGSYNGLDAVYVVGKGSSRGTVENHAWNLVRFSDNYYYGVDVTWDDTTGDMSNFAKGTSSFNRTHTAQQSGWDSENQFFYKLPSNMSSRDYSPSSGLVHNHVFGMWKTTQSATCTEAGIETRTCLTCGQKETRTVKAKGHSFNDTKVSATCTKDGYTEHKCTVCGYTTKDTVVKATGHKYKDTKVAATCTTDGYTEHKCTVCGYTTKDTVVKATGHKYKDTKVAATCTTDGYTEHKCTVCGNTTKDSVVKAKGHKYTDKVTSPTCTAYGHTDHVCSACGDTYRDKQIAPLGHSFKQTSLKAASCTEDGSAEFGCERCEAKYTKIIKAKGHTFKDTVTAPTESADGFTLHECTNNGCGYSYTDTVIPSGGGNYVLSSTVPATCVNDGKNIYFCAETQKSYEQIIKAKGHSFTETVCPPTCTKNGYTEHKCSLCSEKYTDCEIPANGHNYMDKIVPPTATEEGYTEHTCIDCGDSYRDCPTDKITGTMICTIKAVTEGEKPSLTAAEITVYDASGKKLADAVSDSNGITAINSKLADGSYTVKIKLNGFAPRTCSFTVKNGKSSLGEVVLCRYGDLDGNGMINSMDISYFQKSICGWNVPIVYFETGDLNGNGKYDSGELSLIQKYMCGWKIDLDSYEGKTL